MGNKKIKSNQEQTDTYEFLCNQLDKGFTPRWMITYHYKHPSENVRAIRETDKPYGFRDRIGFRTYGDMWKQVASYTAMERKRQSFDNLIKDTLQVKNYILRSAFGIKRVNQEWKYNIPHMIFFHELGKVKLQYHTHLLLPFISNELNSISSIEYFFNEGMRNARKCISRWKSIHIREVDNPEVALSYLNKETWSKHNSLDYQNSNLITS